MIRIAELASIWHVSTELIRAHIRKGALRTYRLPGGDIRISVEDAIQYGDPEQRGRPWPGIPLPPRPPLTPEQEFRKVLRGPGVYFVSAPLVRLIKIGGSKSLGHRIAGLCGSIPIELELLGVLPVKTWRSAEREHHEKFSVLRRRQEWFEDAPDLRAYIAEVCRVPPPRK